MSDRIFGAFGLALAVFYAWATLQIEESFLSDAVGPKTFPLGIAAVLALASLAILLKPDSEPDWPRLGRLAEIAAAVLVMLLYAELLDVLGFVISTMLAAAYLSWRLGTRPLAALVVGIGSSTGIYVIFHLILGLSLARGPFGF
ncbi:MAG: tripartite tricarboxylate transporter TctB family protein [Maritimibacter sp.]